MILNRLKNTFFITGLVFLFILLVFALITRFVDLPGNTEAVMTAIFGGGGTVLATSGVVRAMFAKKQNSSPGH